MNARGFVATLLLTLVYVSGCTTNGDDATVTADIDRGMIRAMSVISPTCVGDADVQKNLGVDGITPIRVTTIPARDELWVTNPRNLVTGRVPATALYRCDGSRYMPDAENVSFIPLSADDPSRGTWKHEAWDANTQYPVVGLVLVVDDEDRDGLFLWVLRNGRSVLVLR
jgi:hypothetical protein